jgi:soluble lytic murein transglycosylase-like protein
MECYEAPLRSVADLILSRVVRNGLVAALASLLLMGCASTGLPRAGFRADAPVVVRSGMDGLITSYAQLYDVPEALIRRIIVRESGYNPRARHGPFWGLMQIRYDTAQSMGYRGPAAGLLNADTNLRYGVRYLRGAWLLSNGSLDKAVRLYASGYYYVAKAHGMLSAVGLR